MNILSKFLNYFTNYILKKLNNLSVVDITQNNGKFAFFYFE